MNAPGCSCIPYRRYLRFQKGYPILQAPISGSGMWTDSMDYSMDYVAPTDVKNYIVFLDPAGILGASLVIVPLVSGNKRAASVFEQASFLPVGGAAAFTLKDVKRMEGNSLWLRYIRQA